MHRPPTILVGCVLLLSAIVGFFGARYWIESRTLRAVDIPVSLARGTINLDFDLNIHAFYSINIGRAEGGNLICGNGAGLWTRRISSVGGLPVYRYRWVEEKSRALGLGEDVIDGDFLGGFEGKRGHYHLRIEVLSDTACLDAGNPRLYILASDQDFRRWNNYYQNAFWILFACGSLGFGLVLAGLRDRLHRRSTETLGIETPVDILIIPIIKPVPWMRLLPQIGFLYAQFFLLLAICGMVTFSGYRRYTTQGLLVNWKTPAAVWGKSPWPEAVEVYVGRSTRFFINGTEVERGQLRSKLLDKIGRRGGWTVYFEADPDTAFADDAYALDTIHACGATVLWVTPKMREEWQHKAH